MLGAVTGSIIEPFGTASGTGTGGVGTYALSVTQTSPVGSIGSPVTIFAYAGYYYTATSSGTGPSGGVVTPIVQAGPAILSPRSAVRARARQR